MIKDRLKSNIINLLRVSYNINTNSDDLLIGPTKKEYKGDYSINVFPFSAKAKKAPPVLAKEIGEQLVNTGDIENFEVIQGFLNITLKQDTWIEILDSISSNPAYGEMEYNDKKILVEFCSPNTNKPLHLGHVRNILLGAATARIYKNNGYTVSQIQVINDRGIAICKSMLAWQKWGNNITPDSSNTKGDHLVGDFYVLFEKEFVKEYKSWQESSQGQEEYGKRKDPNQLEIDFFKEYKNYYFNKYSKLGEEARAMLISWEKGDKEVKELWSKMNNWVYNGFNETLSSLGVHFDHVDYESVTYLLGKKAVEAGVAKNTFYKKEDGSVWVDLTDAGMDQKVVLRSDGTSVYITQDIGTAQMRYEKFKMDKLVYVVADEQDYHFKALFEIMKKLREPYADGLYHLSYGMVELPEGKMKSREGTVVDADDLIRELISEATATAEERGEISDLSKEDQAQAIKNIAMAALKFFMLKVHPKKRMVFNPKESLDMQGQTGPYIQNAFVRIKSVLRKSLNSPNDLFRFYKGIKDEEKELISLFETYPEVVKKAGDQYDPSEIANYSYSLAKAYHKFYHEVPILRSEDQAALHFRLVLSEAVGQILKKSFYLLGIDMPERM